MHKDSTAAIIVNDLDSLARRIEGLEAHPSYTEALIAVQKAKDAMAAGRSAIHHAEMSKRLGA